MRFKRFPCTKIAGEADAIDHVPRRAASREQRGQRGTGDGMHHLILALQPRNQRRTDESASAEYGKR